MGAVMTDELLVALEDAVTFFLDCFFLLRRLLLLDWLVGCAAFLDWCVGLASVSDSEFSSIFIRVAALV